LKNPASITIYRLLQWAAIAVLLGRAYQHFFWDAPYRVLLHDESLMRPFVEGWFHTPWGEYVTNLGVDRAIQTGMGAIGIIFMLGAVVAAFPKASPRPTWKLLVLSSGLLLFLSFLYCKDYNYQVGMFIEHALQVCAPYFFYKLMVKGDINLSRERFMRWATALTFAGHGLYAVGFYPRPGHFTTMVINVFPLPPDAANQVLWAAGILDFLAVVWLVFPVPGRQVFLWYCILWGFATSIARLAANFQVEFWPSILHQWLFEFVYRSPHFLIPVALLLLDAQKRKNRRRVRKGQEILNTSFR